MIKFFRHIRKSLLIENKTSKYFKYALGEIVLVVFGILIALQINNWNEERKNNQSEVIFLEGILNDILQQKKLCDAQIEYESVREKWSLETIEIVKSGSIENKLDSVYKYVDRLKLRFTFGIFNPTYEELKSTGTLKLIKDRNLKNDIVLFYQNLEKWHQIITINNQNIDNIYKKFLLGNSLEFYFNDNNKVMINWKHKPSQILQLSNNLNLRKNLAMSNLYRAQDILTGANRLELKIKKYITSND
jgi:hypothetical protein